jgi:2-polyprenyl-3-methyl-5-hydroxy-6-metoxy-1,4-benzoquinol methylase
MNDMLRTNAYGEHHSLTVVDRFGVWLSSMQVRRSVKSFKGLDVADVGCGFNARFARTLYDQVSSLHLFDVSLSPDLKVLPKVSVHEGDLAQTIQSFPPEKLDVILCLSVVEHLPDPDAVLNRFWHLLRKDGVCLINVPSWRGKWFLEFSAFRLGLSPANEMDDHKFYFDARDLWPRLVKAGFKPSKIKCFSHKFGLNTFACCRK